jgi:hypothetical protein
MMSIVLPLSFSLLTQLLGGDSQKAKEAQKHADPKE